MNISNIKTIYTDHGKYLLDDLEKGLGYFAVETFLYIKSNTTSLEKDLSKITIGTNKIWTCIKKDDITFEIDFKHRAELAGTLTIISDNDIHFEYSEQSLKELYRLGRDQKEDYVKSSLSLLLTYIMLYENKSFFFDKFNLTNA